MTILLVKVVDPVDLRALKEVLGYRESANCAKTWPWEFTQRVKEEVVERVSNVILLVNQSSV